MDVLPSVAILLNEYEKEGKPHLRLGQYFVGKYVKYSWPELFYETEQDKSIESISMYLKQLHYLNELPQKLR
jgi:hypothetical protein